MAYMQILSAGHLLLYISRQSFIHNN